MNILHMDCSTRESSWSRRLSAAVVDHLSADNAPVTVLRRDLGLHPISHAMPAYADSLSTAAAAGAAGPEAHRLSEELIVELETTDMLVLGTPMHNFTVPSVLKAWIDQVLRVGRTIIPTPAGKVGALHDRPVFIAIASGGIFDGEGANQPDFLTPYLTEALSCIGLTSIQFIKLQATAFSADADLITRLDSATRITVYPAID
jgi:FMN-dependent NADH-azoreductase